MNHDYDVAVAGYCPSGLVLASALGRAGHSVAVFQRWPALYGLDHALRDALPLSACRYLNGRGEELPELNWRGSSCGHVEVNQGWAVVTIRPHDDVELAARPWSQSRTGQWWHAGEERVVTAKYLAGADGANSFMTSTCARPTAPSSDTSSHRRAWATACRMASQARANAAGHTGASAAHVQAGRPGQPSVADQPGRRGLHPCQGGRAR